MLLCFFSPFVLVYISIAFTFDLILYSRGSRIVIEKKMSRNGIKRIWKIDNRSIFVLLSGKVYKVKILITTTPVQL